MYSEADNNARMYFEVNNKRMYYDADNYRGVLRQGVQREEVVQGSQQLGRENQTNSCELEVVPVSLFIDRIILDQLYQLLKVR
jgi:hypothetical protein